MRKGADNFLTKPVDMDDLDVFLKKSLELETLRRRDLARRRLDKKEEPYFGDSPAKRCLAAFAGGFIVLYGARLAGGCTSGHMMSGMMQTSLSGYLFALGAFAVAVPVSILLFKKEA